MSRYRAVAITMLLLWIASLILPAAHFTSLEPETRFGPFAKPGLWFLVAGWTTHIAWLGNVMIVACAVCLWADEPAPLWASLATAGLIGSSFTFLGDTVDFEHGSWRVARFEPGFWLWLLAGALPMSVRLAELPGRWRAGPTSDQDSA